LILTPDRLLSLAVSSKNAYAAQPSGIVLDYHDIRAVVTESDGDLVVAVRGTVISSIENWLTDFDAAPSYHVSIGWAPRGFLDSALKLLPLIGPHIAGRRVYLTGHSLGGAVTILLAAMLARTGRAPIAYAAFEPARSGLAGVAASLTDVPGYVCRFGNDPVPELPPIYRHPCAVTAIGVPRLNPFACHSLDGVIAWLQLHTALAA
jgi:triacylglycerol lipase